MHDGCLLFPLKGKDMSEITTFNFKQNLIRTLVIDGEPAFIAGDVCAVLDITNVGNALASLDDDEKGYIHIADGTSGNPNKAYVTEAGMYSLVLRSRKPEARAFKRWITHEVLPAIRKTGSYGAVMVPQSLPDALRAYAAEVEAREALAAKVAADAPKVLFADSVATSNTTILVGELAKILSGNGVDIGGTRLFAVLREDGFLIRRKGTDRNMPTQRSMDLGLFKIKETVITHADGHVTISKTPKVTGKGQAYFVNRYSGKTELQAVAS